MNASEESKLHVGLDPKSGHTREVLRDFDLKLTVETQDQSWKPEQGWGGGGGGMIYPGFGIRRMCEGGGTLFVGLTIIINRIKYCYVDQ